MTYTYAVLNVSPECYREVQEKLSQAGYQHAFHESEGAVVIDMHGIALGCPTVFNLCICGHPEADHQRAAPLYRARCRTCSEATPSTAQPFHVFVQKDER